MPGADRPVLAAVGEFRESGLPGQLVENVVVEGNGLARAGAFDVFDEIAGRIVGSPD